MVLLIRFAPGLRIALAAACAWVDVSPRKFSLLNLLSAFAWAVVMLVFVAWLGPTSLARSDSAAGRARSSSASCCSCCSSARRRPNAAPCGTTPIFSQKEDNNHGCYRKIWHPRGSRDGNKSFGTAASASSSSQGPHIEAFEQEFARLLGSGYVRTCSTEYGRMALYFILKAMDLPAGSEIIVPALTFWVVPEITRVAGLKPVFADIDPDTFTLCPRRWSARSRRRPAPSCRPTSTACPATWIRSSSSRGDTI